MNKNYNFLSNKPLGEDKFEGKSQEKIASVLGDILNDDKFQIIGIDGSWGTGKSNLVEIVKRKSPEHNFFIYDVWGHQEDEQRRAILIELTESLSQNKIIKNKKVWDEKLRILLSKKKTITTINQPYLSIGFILSLFAIIYAPIVNVFVDTGGYKSFSDDWWRLIIVGFPIVLILIILLCKLSYQLICKRKNLKESALLAVQQTFQVYTDKQEKETKIENISEDEPSVQEFRNWMKDIDSDLNDKKLVIVFDNFDRLPKRHILSIWSSLHVFFSEEKYKNIKVLVPFDRNHIQNAFKELNGEKDSYAKDYIDKTFDLVYRVSPPILSSWKVFFKELWQEAFLSFDENEYLKVEQAYEVFRPNITPREIITFINEVVSIKLLDDNIPDRYIAVFVLNKGKIIEDPLKAITSLDYLKSLKELYQFDSDFQKYITSLSYQIDPKNAMEVVYRKQLKTALIDGDSDSFRKLLDLSVLNSIIESVLNELDDLKAPIIAMKELEENERFSDLFINHIWENIYFKLSSKELKDRELDDYHKILLSKIRLEHRKKWLKTILDKLRNHDVFDPIIYSQSINELEELNNKRDLELDVFKSLKVKEVDPVQFIKLIEEYKEDYIKFKIDCSFNTLDEHLAALDLQNILKINFLQFYKNPTTLIKFEKQLIKHANDNKSNVDILEKIINHLKIVSIKPIDTFLSDAELHSLMSQSNIDKPFYTDLLIMKIKQGVANHPSYQPVYDKALNTDNAEFIKKVSEKIEDYLSYDEFLVKSLEFKKPIFKSVTKLMISPDYSIRIIKIKPVLENFNKIISHNELKGGELLIKLDEKYSEDLSFDLNFVWGLSNEVFEYLIQNEVEISLEIISIIIDHFNNLDAEGWSKVFHSLNSRELKILQLFDYTTWNGYALEEFKKKLTDIVRKKEIENSDTIKFLLENFEKGNKNLSEAFKNIRDELITERNITDEIFLVLGSWLFKYGSLEERASEVFRTILISSLFENENSVDLLLIKSDEIKMIKDAAGEDGALDFIEGIKTRESNEKIQELAELLNISFPKKKNEDETDNED